MKYVDEIELRGKKVFVRADLNVPIKDGIVQDDHRVTSALKTVDYILHQGGSVILASHLGRPKGTRNEKYSLKPVARRIEEITGKPVIMAPDCIGDEVERLAANLKPGDVLVLENLRFYAEEEKNDIEFAKKLAKLADVYVNDAFGAAHRAHASTAAMAAFVSVKAGGFTVKDEREYFIKAFKDAQPPLLAIMGGAKMETKIEAIKHVANKANVILIGGAMANTFFKALGHKVGISLVEDSELDNALSVIADVKGKNCTLVLPIDVLCAQKFEAGAPTRACDITDIRDDEMAVDIGPKTIDLFRKHIGEAKTIIWNGPLGGFEIPDFSAGTFAIIDAMACANALTVIGGGDTDLALHQRHAFDKMSYVSTGGGAFLELLEGKTLPGFAALE